MVAKNSSQRKAVVSKKPKIAKAAAAPKKKPVSPLYSDPNSINVFCEYIAQGGHMAGFCKENGVRYSNWTKWIHSDADRAVMYARAREERADVLADEIVSISDETKVEKVKDEDGNEVDLKLDATAVARNRLRIDARKWVASKLKPRIYGEKITNEITGQGGGPVQFTFASLKGLTDAELETMHALMAKAAAAA